MKLNPVFSNALKIALCFNETPRRVSTILLMCALFFSHTLQAQNAGGTQQGASSINAKQSGGTEVTNPFQKGVTVPGSEEAEKEDADEEEENDKYDGPAQAAEFEYERTKNPSTNKR